MSATQVQAAITAADIATAGTGQVTAFNPAPGGGTSGASTFTINAPNPMPTISTLSPALATAGTGAFTLMVNGTGFINGSVVNWNGTSRTTTYMSATQVQAAITAADIATAGTGQVTAFNPTPGGGTSGNSAFTINASVMVSFVQATANRASGAKKFSLSFASKTVAGDLILVGFDFYSNAKFSSITDSQGNVFAEVGSQLKSPSGYYSRVYYANNIKGGADTVTVNLSANSNVLEVYLAEYSGVNQVTPIDAQADASGAAGGVSSGNATTTVAGDVIYGYCFADNTCNAGSGFTSRSTFDSNLIEDMIAGNPGSYAATGTANEGWTMQMVALKPASLSAKAVALVPSVSSAVVGAGTSGGVSTGAMDLHPQPTSLPQNVLVDLSCIPKTIDAGSQATCKLQVVANSVPSQIRVTSTSQQVKTPTVVQARANQTSLTFQVSADAGARQQVVAVTASAGGATVQDTIQVTAASRPILTVPGKQAIRFGAPVRFTIGTLDAGEQPVQLTAAGVPAGASFDPVSGRFEWVPSTAQAGKYQIDFIATNSAGQSSHAQVPLEVDSGLPVLTSGQPLSCSPGSVASLTGKWLAVPDSMLTDPSGSTMDLGGTKVRVNGEYVPVLAASATRVSFLCPALDVGTRLAVAVETALGITDPVTATVAGAAPRILSLNDSSQGQGLVFFGETNEMAMVRNFRVPAHPAQPDDRILIWATGLGVAGGDSSRTVFVNCDGVPAEVESVQPVVGYAGLYAIEARVPAATPIGDAVPLQLMVATPDGEQLHSNTVTIAVEPASQ